jgi:hypothetical protein
LLVEAEATVERRGTDPVHRLTVRLAVDLASPGARRCFDDANVDVVHLASEWDARHDLLDWDGSCMADACRAGAWSGASFASRRAGRWQCHIELRAVRGQVDTRAGEGTAVASMYAVWTACGHEWTRDDDRETYGWSLVAAAGGMSAVRS